MVNIDQNTLISKGMQLSKNFILAHTSSGSYHYLLGKIIPQFTAFLKPGNSGVPLWQVASNLQMGSDGILEKLLNAFGSDLILRSGFLNTSSESADSLGQSFSVQVRGYENNMYNVSKMIQNLSNKASSLSLVYGNTSFIKINFDEKSIKNNILSNATPTLNTVDQLNGILELGLTSLRGL